MAADDHERERQHRTSLLFDGVRSRVDDARSRAARAHERLEAARVRSRPVALGFEMWDRDRAAFGPLLAAALAFRLFLFIVPFTVFLLAAVGQVAVSEGSLATSKALGLRGTLASAVNQSTSETQTSRWLLLLAGLFGSLYVGAKAAKTIRTAHAAVWGIARPRRSLARDAFWFFLTNVALLLATLGVAWVRRHTEFGVGLLVTLATVIVWLAAWLLVSAHMPHGDAPVWALVPGAVLVALGAEVLHLVTTYFLMYKAEHAQSVYGAIGVALVTLSWLFIVARLIVASAVLNAVLWEAHVRRRGRAAHHPGPGAQNASGIRAGARSGST